MPWELVATEAEIELPRKVPLGPEEGAVKVATIPGTALPELSLNAACNETVNGMGTAVCWLLPAVGLMDVGGPNAGKRSPGVPPSSPPAISSRPSPLKSPTATPFGFAATENAAPAVKLPAPSPVKT